MALDTVVLLCCSGVPVVRWLMSLDPTDSNTPAMPTPKDRVIRRIRRGQVRHRKGWMLGCVICFALFVLGYSWKPYLTVYEEVGISPRARRSDIYAVYKARKNVLNAPQDDDQDREAAEQIARLDYLYQNVLKDSTYRKAYNRFGDYFHMGDAAGQKGTVDPPFLQVVAHSAVCVLLMQCLALALGYGLPSVVSQGAFLYLIACFCADIYTRFVDASVLLTPFHYIPGTADMLPFEAVQTARRLFPGVLVALVLFAEAFAQNRNSKMAQLIRSCIRTNAAIFASLKYQQDVSVLVNPDLKDSAGTQPAVDIESEEERQATARHKKAVDDFVALEDDEIEAGIGFHRYIAAAMLILAIFSSSGSAVSHDEM